MLTWQASCNYGYLDRDTVVTWCNGSAVTKQFDCRVVTAHKETQIVSLYPTILSPQYIIFQHHILLALQLETEYHFTTIVDTLQLK